MENSQIFPYIDHTLLKATSTEEQIKQLCEEALLYHTASVCIPASYVKFARDKFPKLNICTVIGFPLGYSTTAVKCFEAKSAIQDGADEIDMVINLGWVKDGKFLEVEREIADVKAACGDKILKVIIETCYLTENEKIELCKCVTNAKADYIKTSTGFGTDGAKIEDICLFKKHIGENVKIKAAGGVKTKADLEWFLSEGCERIGTSSAVKLLLGEESWIEVTDDAAIEKLMSDFHGFHDSVIVSISYNSGSYVDEDEIMYQMTSADEHTLLMTLHSQWSKPIELFFSGVRCCNIVDYWDGYSTDLYDATLEFRTDLLGETRDDALIVWADYRGFDIKQHTERYPLDNGNGYKDTYIIANKLKYRIIDRG